MHSYLHMALHISNRILQGSGYGESVITVLHNASLKPKYYLKNDAVLNVRLLFRWDLARKTENFVSKFVLFHQYSTILP